MIFKYVSGGLAVICLGLYIATQWQANRILQMEAEIVSVTIERDVSRGNEKAAKDRAEIQTTQILAFEGRIARIEKQRAEALTRLEYVEGLFKDDRFQRLLGANPTLITLRMKKATAAMLLELENATTH